MSHNLVVSYRRGEGKVTQEKGEGGQAFSVEGGDEHDDVDDE